MSIKSKPNERTNALWAWLTLRRTVGPTDPVFRGPALSLVPREARTPLLERLRTRILPPSWLAWAVAFVVLLVTIPKFAGAYSRMLAGLLALGFGVYTAITKHRRRNALLLDELARRACWECGYSLIGLHEPRCPECGASFDAAVYDRIAEELERTGRPAPEAP